MNKREEYLIETKSCAVSIITALKVKFRPDRGAIQECRSLPKVNTTSYLTRALVVDNLENTKNNCSAQTRTRL